MSTGKSLKTMASRAEMGGGGAAMTMTASFTTVMGVVRDVSQKDLGGSSAAEEMGGLDCLSRTGWVALLRQCGRLLLLDGDGDAEEDVLEFSVAGSAGEDEAEARRQREQSMSRLRCLSEVSEAGAGEGAAEEDGRKQLLTRAQAVQVRGAPYAVTH
jgi:hypothetical protein